MSRLGSCDRRSFLALAATWLASSRIGSLLAKEPTSSRGAVAPLRARSRRYSVRATVMVGSIPIFTKTHVGGALLTVEESSAVECQAIALQFGAGTWPERLKGFNGFGVTHETVRIEHGRLTESSYYGFMTTSGEANLSQAEEAFRNTLSSIPLTVGYGQSTAAGCSSTIQHQAVPPTFSWSDCAKLMCELREQKPRFSEPPLGPRQPSLLPTFLYAVRQAILSGVPNGSIRYTYDGQTYTLPTERRPDNNPGETVITAWICHEQSDLSAGNRRAPTSAGSNPPPVMTTCSHLVQR